MCLCSEWFNLVAALGVREEQALWFDYWSQVLSLASSAGEISPTRKAAGVDMRDPDSEPPSGWPRISELATRADGY